MTILYLKNKRINSGRIAKPWAIKNLFQACGHCVSLLFVSGTKKTEEILYSLYYTESHYFHTICNMYRKGEQLCRTYARETG